MNNFKKNIYKLQTKSCGLNPLIITTTDPTNQASNNGTATVTYSGAEDIISYNINGGAFTTVTSSPFTIQNLSSNTTYTVIVKDDVESGCERSSIFTLGETSFVFDADYIMVTYQFTDGRDLDTRTRIVTPDIGQNTQDSYLGWRVRQIYPITGIPYETWGGDNTGTGFESVLVDLNIFRAAYPSATNIVMDMRGFWYGQLGVNNVNITATLWKGGAYVKSGFVWNNPTAQSTLVINSTGKKVNLVTQSNQSSGERIATFTYDLILNEGTLNNNDTTTPSV